MSLKYDLFFPLIYNWVHNSCHSRQSFKNINICYNTIIFKWNQKRWTGMFFTTSTAGINVCEAMMGTDVLKTLNCRDTLNL